MTENEARMIGKAICEEARLIRLPLQDPIEQRAVCLKFAIETEGIASARIRPDSTMAEAAERVLDAARLYYAFVSESESVNA